MPKRWPGPRYEVRAKFHAPLDFVYRWCTDYTPDDGLFEEESYQRRILRRTPREVIYEDLEDTKGGWFWSRHVVRLLPPDRWHSDSVGSHRAYSLDYTLTKIPGDWTQLILTARRRPYGVGGKNPPRAQWEGSVARSWKAFGRALERDYRRTRSKRV
ncbi:MAG: hypothetical protein WA761_03530 [Thermoplasmata archaeon]